MTETDSLAAGWLASARERLVASLRDLTELVADSALTRCPYRALEDLCTFGHGCRNQVRSSADTARCGGGSLNAAPATPLTDEVNRG